MTPEQIAFFRRHLTATGAIAANATDAEVVAAATRAADEPSIRLPATDDSGRLAPSIVPESLDIPARTVRDTILATERPVVMPDYTRGEYVDEVLLMAGFVPMPAGERIPMLDSHNRYSIEHILGSMSNLRVVGDQLHSTSEFSTATKKATEAFDNVQQGHLRGVSVGYRVQAATYIPVGDKAVVNGREIANAGKRTLKIATRWTVAEGSPCAIGADSGCGFRSAAPAPNLTNPAPTTNQPPTGEIPMTRQQLIDSLTARGYTADEAGRMADAILTAPESARKALLDSYPTRTAPAPVPPAPPAADPAAAARAAELVAERTRVQAIRTSETQVANLFAGRLTPAAIRSLTDAAIADGNGTGDSLLAAAARAAAASQTPINQGGTQLLTDGSDTAREVLQTVIMHRAGVAVPQGSDPAADRRRSDIIATHGGMSLVAMARHALEANGVSLRGMGIRELVGRAITHSSGDFTHALGTSAHRTMLAAYASAPSNWRAYCRTMPMADFRTHNLIRTSEFGVMDAVPEGSPLPEGTFSDKKETMSLVSFKKGFSVTREAIINDDLGIFTSIPAGLARSWARTINQQAIKVLLTNAALQDSIALFHASHNNLNTSTAITTKETAETAIRALSLLLQQQQDMDGKSYLQLMPSVILCSPTKSLWLIQAVGEVGRADNNRAIDIAQYNLRVVADMELENTTLTGYGTNLTYAFANPADAPTVIVGFLEGNDAPILESREGWTVDGTEFKVIGDVAAGVSDYRGAAKHVA